MSERTELINGIEQRMRSTPLGDIREVESVDPSGNDAPLDAPPTYTAHQTQATAIGATDAAATFSGPQKKVTLVATAACFINFDAAAVAAIGATGFPLAANVPQTFDGPISAIHVIAAAAGGVLIAYGVS